MKTISALELRREFPKILRRLQASRETIRLTFRGKAVADIVPVKPAPARPPSDDPFYRMAEMAVNGPSLSNLDIDKELYGGSEGVR